MHDVIEPFRLDPNAIYDDASLVLALGLTLAVLSRARREGKLRYARQGRRILYRGSWLSEWLEQESRQWGEEGASHG